jgi:hypothetical protein
MDGERGSKGEEERKVSLDIVYKQNSTQQESSERSPERFGQGMSDLEVVEDKKTSSDIKDVEKNQI